MKNVVIDNVYVRRKFAEYLGKTLTQRLLGVADDIEQLRWLVGKESTAEMDMAVKHVRAQLALAATHLQDAFSALEIHFTETELE